MATFKRTGSTTLFLYDGELPAVRSDDFAQALRKRRFRTIESATSEETSSGWITVEDPTGDSFGPEAIEHGPALWLRVRMDKKSLPPKWLAIHRAAAERAAGRKLSTREKRELKEDLMEKLLPRVLPSVQWLDALCIPDRRLVLLMSTSRNTIEAFGKLFFESFGLRLEVGDPYRLALAAGLSSDQQRALDRTSPVRWPGGGSRGTPTSAVPGGAVEESA